MEHKGRGKLTLPAPLGQRVRAATVPREPILTWQDVITKGIPGAMDIHSELVLNVNRWILVWNLSSYGRTIGGLDSYWLPDHLCCGRSRALCCLVCLVRSNAKTTSRWVGICVGLLSHVLLVSVLFAVTMLVGKRHSGAWQTFTNLW